VEGAYQDRSESTAPATDAKPIVIARGRRTEAATGS
jgi:hypothetical protein